MRVHVVWEHKFPKAPLRSRRVIEMRTLGGHSHTDWGGVGRKESGTSGGIDRDQQAQAQAHAHTHHKTRAKPKLRQRHCSAAPTPGVSRFPPPSSSPSSSSLFLPLLPSIPSPSRLIPSRLHRRLLVDLPHYLLRAPAPLWVPPGRKISI